MGRITPFYLPCDLILLLHSATMSFVVNSICNAVAGIKPDDLTFTAGQAMKFHQLRHEADDFDFHVSRETLERIRQLNPQLEVRECSLGLSLNGQVREHRFSFFCLGDLETHPLIFEEHSSTYRVLTLHQLRKQKWQLIWMWDRPWRKKLQDLGDLVAIRQGFQHWRLPRRITPKHTASLRTSDVKG